MNADDKEMINLFNSYIVYAEEYNEDNNDNNDESSTTTECPENSTQFELQDYGNLE